MSSFAWVGKIPSEGDYVRCDVADESVMHFFTWLVDNHVNAASRGLDVNQPLAVVHLDNPVAPVAGVIIPSVDSVGRRFPLAAVRRIDEAALKQSFAALPIAWSRTVPALIHQLRAVQEKYASHIGEGSADLYNAWMSSCVGLSQTRVSQLCGGIFTKRSALAYAMQVVEVFLQDPEGRTLHAPIQNVVDAFFWMELLRRRGGTPSVVCWSLSSPASIALSFGPSSLTFAGLQQPNIDATRVWPVLTNSEVAEMAALEHFVSLPSENDVATSIFSALEPISRLA